MDMESNDVINKQKTLLASFLKSHEIYPAEIKKAKENYDNFYERIKNLHARATQELSNASLENKDEYFLNWDSPKNNYDDPKYCDDFLSKLWQDKIIKNTDSYINTLDKDIANFILAVEKYNKNKSTLIIIASLLSIFLIGKIFIFNASNNTKNDNNTEVTKQTSSKDEEKNLAHNLEDGIEDVKQMLSLAVNDGAIKNHDAIVNMVYVLNGKFPCPHQQYDKKAKNLNETGINFSNQKKYTEALKYFSMAHSIEPTNIEMMNNLAYVYMQLGDLKNAEKLLLKTLVYDPARGSAWNNLAQVHAREDDDDIQLAVAAFSNNLRFTRDINKTHEALSNLAETHEDSTVKAAAAQANQLPYIEPTPIKSCTTKGK